MRAFILIAIFGAGLLPGCAMAQSLCVEPQLPAAAPGATATADQLRVTMADARNFVAQSTVYQDCLLKEVEAAKTQAASSGQPFEPAMETSALYKVEASKKAQQKVSDAANGALTAYKNPRPN